MALVDAESRPVYQEIVPKALQLRELGLTDQVITKRLCVSDKNGGEGYSVAAWPLPLTQWQADSVGGGVFLRASE
jgi:hypothetical protein